MKKLLVFIALLLAMPVVHAMIPERLRTPVVREAALAEDQWHQLKDFECLKFTNLEVELG